MDELLWPLILLLVGLSLLVLEAFIPSGGILSLLSALGIIGAVALAYASAGTVPATLFLLLTAVAVPTAIVLLVRWWPHTALGKLILIQPQPADEMVPDLSPLRSLVGAVGRTKSKMLPGGAVRIEGKSYDAVTEGVSLDAGIAVQVVAVRGRSLVVRRTDRLPGAPSGHDAEQAVAGSSGQESVPDPFADPLT
jgi:membrane-bound ClpP family serine protease